MALESRQDIAVEVMHNPHATTNGIHVNGHGEPPLEILEAELPLVDFEQVPLGELLSRFAQTIYAELIEMAETLPNTSDAARKRTIADWVVRTKKQAVKLYAVAKWARDAETVQKSMNITAFLMNQNHQFEEAIRTIQMTKDSLDPARLRNHDLLTSLDVLTTGSYLRLPTCIKKAIIPPTPLTDGEVDQVLSGMEDVMQYRLRMSEIVPVEMTSHRIAGGRVHFTVPNLFEASICLRGAEPQEGWFFVDVEFQFNVSGDLTSLQEFPRVPTGIMKRHIAEEADNRLGRYIALPPDTYPPGVEVPPRPTLPDGVVDAPLVRLYNFLQMMSLSYQLEILWFQAERMRALGWANYLSVQMSRDRKAMTVNYWLRPLPSRNLLLRQRIKLPPHGGTLIIAIVEAKSPPQLGGGPARTHKARILSRIQKKAKLGAGRPSDEVEGLRFSVKWEASKGALGVNIPPQELALPADILCVNPDRLDFEAMLRTILEKHSRALLNAFHHQLRNGPARAIFSRPNDVKHENDVLRVHMCADEVAVVSIDVRTGQLSLRDTGDLAAAGRGPQFSKATMHVNEYPMFLETILISLRLMTIMDLVEQKAKYLGLRVFRHRNFPQPELAKLGNSRQNLFIQLANFPSHYLVVVVTDPQFRFALITTTVKNGSGNALNPIPNEPMSSYMVMEDIAWLDFDRIRNQDSSGLYSHYASGLRQPGKDPSACVEEQDPFNIETQSLKDLYSYCCARVAYMNVERQLKLRGIPFTHVSSSNGHVPPELTHIQSPLARSVPALCVQAADILSGAPAAEAAMPNIRVVPLNWWSDKDAQVITCVKLKYVQQPMGRSTTTSSVIRPSKRIIYDTTEAVVSFLSQDVNTCVNEFLEEWARVSKMVVIAREIAQMAKNEELKGVRLLSFDLQTVEFLYGLDYTVSLSCEDQLSLTGGNFILRFGRYRPRRDASAASILRKDNDNSYNPHDEAESFFRSILRHGNRLAPSLHRLVVLLRDTLPIVAELEEIRLESEKQNENIDTFAKSAGWYRLLYGDLRHALDFRLLHDKRVAIIDASHPVCYADRKKNPMAIAVDSNTLEIPGLQSIPQFNEVVNSAVKQALSNGSAKPGRVALIDVGVVCDATAVQGLGRIIHRGVLEKLKSISSSTSPTIPSSSSSSSAT